MAADDRKVENESSAAKEKKVISIRAKVSFDAFDFVANFPAKISIQ